LGIAARSLPQDHAAEEVAGVLVEGGVRVAHRTDLALAVVAELDRLRLGDGTDRDALRVWVVDLGEEVVRGER
jgi:hypothetical protein